MSLQASSGGYPPAKIAVFRALQLGDLLCAVPAFRALKGLFPEAQITLVGLPWAQLFVERFPQYLDDLLEFPGYPGLPEATCEPAASLKFLAEAQSRRFDLVIQMHGSGAVSNPLTVLMGGRINSGFYAPGSYCPDHLFFFPYPENEPEIWRNLRLMEFLGAPCTGDRLEFPIWSEDVREFRELAETHGLQPGGFVCIHPGSRHPKRRWSTENFAQVADRLAADGLKIVLTGSMEERVLVRAVQSRMRNSAVDLTGKTSLGAMAALLDACALLVSNDTGVSHLAVALEVPSVVVFSGSDPARWAPLNQKLHRSLGNPLDKDLQPVAPASVLKEAKRVLRNRESGRASAEGRGGLVPYSGRKSTGFWWPLPGGRSS
jgi:ADP-heptose:LPS heptosyltransferase